MKIKKVIILGSGSIKIGEAGEFDYSGSQALKSLKEEGIETVLVNPNIATIQSSMDLCDKVYFLPITKDFVEKVIEKEKPEGILLSFGGQTALNCGVELYDSGILEKHNVKVLGTPVEAIKATEDRVLFAQKLDEINISRPKSFTLESLKDINEAIEYLSFPIIARAEYALGGMGSGFASSKEELLVLVKNLLIHNDKVLLDESVKGWKEVEYEIVRDANDNCIAVCNMENFDPVGIHTGESVVVAPSQTLNNHEYFKLRDIAFKIVRHLKIVGECNVQFALDTHSDEYRVIEVNARLSRSSALASKATGYPLAYIAVKLILGQSLPELKNPITQTTPAFFEPALDYVVCKFPKWDLDKFYGSEKEIGSSMKSVGEVMSIGRTFEEAFQKGLRMLDNGYIGFTCNGDKIRLRSDIETELTYPTDKRVLAIEKAFESGKTVEEIAILTQINPFFLKKLNNIFETKRELESFSSLNNIDAELVRYAKQLGFSDAQIAYCVFGGGDKISAQRVREWRKKNNILPFVKQIDTLAAEYPAQTNYLYLTYSADAHDTVINTGQKSIITLGSGVYRIGSSVEFDWCCVLAVAEFKKRNYQSIMINCNPETVSTDYDICDKLFFEELTLERILDIADIEQPEGLAVSFGGQSSNNIALKLHENGIKILGTDAGKIHDAESRNTFSSILDTLGVKQPIWEEVVSEASLRNFIEKVGFPILIRPSYVLSGTSMNIIYNEEELQHALAEIHALSSDYPIVASQFIENGREIEFDGVANEGKTIISVLSEHIENAGVHSGDATLCFPCQTIGSNDLEKIKEIGKTIAERYQISGPFNIQFIVKDGDIRVIELNLRSSRTLPFISKVMGINMIELAVSAMLKEPQTPIEFEKLVKDRVGVKAPQFSFSRIKGANPILGVEMASTGEVGCFGKNKEEALFKAMLSVGFKVPQKGVLVTLNNEKEIQLFEESINSLVNYGLKVYLNPFAYDYCKETLQITSPLLKNSAHIESMNELIQNHEIDMLINIPKHPSKTFLDDTYLLRRKAIDHNIYVFTNIQLSNAVIKSFTELSLEDLEIKNWREYL